MRACMHGRGDIVRYLLNEYQDKININYVNKNGFTALDIAEGLGNIEIAGLLSQHKAQHSNGWAENKEIATRDTLLEKKGWADFLKERDSVQEFAI